MDRRLIIIILLLIAQIIAAVALGVGVQNQLNQLKDAVNRLNSVAEVCDDLQGLKNRVMDKLSDAENTTLNEILNKCP